MSTATAVYGITASSARVLNEFPSELHLGEDGAANRGAWLPGFPLRVFSFSARRALDTRAPHMWNSVIRLKHRQHPGWRWWLWSRRILSTG